MTRDHEKGLSTEILARWSVPTLLIAMWVTANFWLPIAVDDPFKSTTEFVGSVGAWLTIAAIAMTNPWAPAMLRHKRLMQWSLALVGWFAVSSVFAYNPMAAWRYACLATTFIAFGIALLVWLEGDRQRRNLLLVLLFGSLVIQMGVAATQIARMSLIGWTGVLGPLKDWAQMVEAGVRQGIPLGTLGNTNYLAEWLSLTAPVAIAALFTWGRGFRLAVPVVLIGCAWLLWTTGTRGVWLGLLCAIPAAFWLTWQSRPKLGWPAIAASVVLVTGMLFIAHRYVGAALMESSIALRLASWRTALEIWWSHPITGAGLGGFKVLSVQTMPIAHPMGVMPQSVTERLIQVHNEPLQILAEIGLIGLILVGCLVVTWTVEAAKNTSWATINRFGFLAGVGAVLIAGCFGFPLHIPLTALTLSMVVVLGVSRTEVVEPTFSQPSQWQVAALAVCLGTAALVFDAWPNYLAQRAAYEADQFRLAGNWPAAEDAYNKANDGLRFKGQLRWYQLAVHVQQAEFGKALALYEASERDGMGIDTEFWHGRALEGEGRFAEAQVAYRRVVTAFQNGHPLSERAQARIDALTSLSRSPALVSD